MKHTKNTKNTFTREIPTLVIVFMAFGLAPILSNPRLQVFFQFYQLLLCSVIIALFVYVTYFVGYSQRRISTPVSAMVFISKIISHLVTLGEAYFTRKKQQEFFETIFEINESFRTKLGMQFDLKEIKNTVKLRATLLVVIIPIVYFTVLAYYSFTVGDIFLWCGVYSSMTLIVRCLQNITYVTLIEGHLNFVNECIKEIILRNAHFQPFVIFAQEYRQLSKKQSAEKLPQIPENKRILEMKQIFNRLWDAMNLINDCFGWSLLIISISYFISITTCAFYLFVVLQENFFSDVTLYIISTFIQIIVVLGIFALACQNCARCGHDTGTLLQKIKKVEDESYNFLVSEFQLQVMHEPFEMSAHGFFIMNFEFLGSMAAASVTYLVILIQFVFNEAKTPDIP